MEQICNTVMVTSDEYAELKAALEASQARENVLRDALRAIRRISNATGICWMIDELMAQSTDDTALKAALAAERERFLSIVEEHTDEDGICAADDVIRALGD